jgi:hypothetical protein
LLHQGCIFIKDSALNKTAVAIAGEWKMNLSEGLPVTLEVKRDWTTSVCLNISYYNLGNTLVNSSAKELD